MWVGIDDTDSPSGGCTTWVLTELIRESRELDLIGYPRLVRLNPNIPFKTRGNAALSARFGHGKGRSFSIGTLAGEPVPAYPRGTELTDREGDSLFERGITVLRAHSRWGEKGTDPALVLSSRRLDERFYWRAVRDVVDPAEAWDAVAVAKGARAAAFGDGRGIVGACAAISWPARRRTWEAIAYRSEDRWGTEREVRPDSVLRMEGRHPETFLSWDGLTRRLLVAPHTKCPILFGVRAKTPSGLGKAVREVSSEPFERWITFVTNQATGDHLREMSVAEAKPASSPILTGHVVSPPIVGRGGHVQLWVGDSTGEIPCVAFEPSKTLGPVVSHLRVGDRVRIWGSLPWDGEQRALRIEGLQVLDLVASTQKLANPRCTACGGTTSSVGHGKGFRCKRCRATSPPESAITQSLDRSALRGLHLPTPSARRHLSPLTLIRPYVVPEGRAS